MPTLEIKELRNAGMLDEALTMAKAELQDALASLEPVDENTKLSLLRRVLNEQWLLWPKRNLGWVYYEYLKLNNDPGRFDVFISWIDEINLLELSEREKVLFNAIGWEVSKLAFRLSQKKHLSARRKGKQLFDAIRSFHFDKSTDAYSFLFRAFHALLKGSEFYIEFSDWWGFENFLPDDFEKKKLENGREIMAVAEQAYITYAKQLLPRKDPDGSILFDREKVMNFLPLLNKLVEKCPQFQYPAYFQAKLLLALGNKENMLEALLPFAKKKRNDFWVWEILAEAFPNEEDKAFACYCKALSCNAPEEMLIGLRQKMAEKLIARKSFNEAKTEIVQVIEARKKKAFKIPPQINQWVLESWYRSAVAAANNNRFYTRFLSDAEAILFSDIPEEMVIVEFVNRDRSILNFIASDKKFGFFKYDRYISDVQVGDILKIRIKSGVNEGLYHLYTAVKVHNDTFKAGFIRSVAGKLNIPAGNSFGFVGDVFVHSSVISGRKLKNGDELTGDAIKSYNKEKKQWSWKLL